MNTTTYKGTEYTADQIKQMRNWAKDCQWADGEGPDFIDELTDLQIVRGVAKHYAGGLSQFISDCEPAKIPPFLMVADNHVLGIAPANERKPMYENEMTKAVGLIATCNGCERIIFEDENYKEQYIASHGYCRECNEASNELQEAAVVYPKSNQVVIVYQTDVHHSHNSRKLIAICDSKPTAIDTISTFVWNEYKALLTEHDEHLLNTINQTQGDSETDNPFEGEFVIETVTINEIVV